MSDATAINYKGEAGEKVKLVTGLFGGAVNPPLQAQAVRIFLSNQRRAAAKTKTRSEVSKTTAKMYKQKGTGRARHGAYSAPIFVGGGIAHGPRGMQNYRMNLPKYLRRAAIVSVLTQKAKAGSVQVLTGADKLTKTSQAEKLLKGKTLVIIAIKQGAVRRAFNNIQNAEVLSSNNLNAFKLLKYKQLLFTKEGLAETEKTYVN